MKNTIKRMQVVSLVLVLALFCGVAATEAKMVPKVDNFILFPDQSGSMYMTLQSMGETKMVLAKKLLLDMNQLIPELGYKGSLYMFAPFKELSPPAVYEREAMGSALQTIPEDQAIFGRLTPMGPGIDQLGPVLGGLSGKTAIIVLSDGAANLGADPVAMARNLYNQYPEICFHVISFADTEQGKAINQAINQVGGNCVFAEGTVLLQDRAALEQFVKDVFYMEEGEAVQEEVMVLRGIHFDFDKYNIKPEWEPVLDEAADVLTANPNIRVIIEGHTDAVGTDAYNMRLSERRAGAVYDYLLRKGIAANRMSTVGYGESQPKAGNDTAEGRAINRRVELKVTQ